MQRTTTCTASTPQNSCYAAATLSLHCNTAATQQHCQTELRGCCAPGLHCCYTAARELPSGGAALGSALHRGCAGPGLGDDVGVVTAHEVALSNLSLLLLQHCVQVLVACRTISCLSTGEVQAMHMGGVDSNKLCTGACHLQDKQLPEHR